jgi:hypothetical protein
MRIEFEPISTLPRLSWCARVRRGGAVRVLHGEGVETRGDRFVEGAWDGDFEQFDFDSARSLAGSGGALRDGACVFAGPFHPLERLYVIQGDEETLVSNSLVFVLEQAGDGPDLSHPDYFFDLVRMVRRGVESQPAARLRTAGGRQVELYSACRLRINAELRLGWTPLAPGPPPADYGEYFAMLLGTCRAIVDNAAHPARRSTFTPVAACSRGYDSVASAALAAQVGCKEGVTFVRSGTPKGHPITGLKKPLQDDSGSDALRALGMNVHEYDRLKALEIPGHPKAEFFMSFSAVTDFALRVMEDKLRGSVYFSGRHAERYWGPTARCKRLHFRELDDIGLSGHASPEFRMRTGYVHLPAPYIGALNGPAIFRITHSPEMLPWKLGTGYYDRPIARRIAEEAGVPRECFGHTKFGGSEATQKLPPESLKDFLTFVETEVPEAVRRGLDWRDPDERLKNHYRIKYLRTQYSHYPGSSWLLDVLGTDRLHRLWNSVYLYVFHWGLEKTRARYKV